MFVFDVEGTLIDAMMPTLHCWRETLEASGHEVSPADLHRLCGMDGDEMLAQLLPKSSRPEREALIKRQGERYREQCLPQVAAFPGVRDLFQDLKRRQGRIALATDCAKDELQHYLSLAAIEDVVDAMACGDDVPHGKPHPDVIELALRRVRAGRKPAVMIGDTPFDAQAARRAGIQAVGVLTGHFSEAALREAGCSAVFRDVAALRDHFAGNTGETAAGSAPAAWSD